jgi:hypothetical protein
MVTHGFREATQGNNTVNLSCYGPTFWFILSSGESVIGE